MLCLKKESHSCFLHLFISTITFLGRWKARFWQLYIFQTLTNPTPYTDLCLPKSLHFSSQHLWHLTKFNIICFSNLPMYFSSICLFLVFYVYSNLCVYLVPLEKNINKGKQEDSLPLASSKIDGSLLSVSALFCSVYILFYFSAAFLSNREHQEYSTCTLFCFSTTKKNPP